MVPGAADKLVRLMPEFGRALYEIGVRPSDVVVQIEGLRNLHRLSGHVAMSLGLVWDSDDKFELYGIRFEVRELPKPWTGPTVSELFVQDPWGRMLPVSNR